ncbi:MAG: tRNA pseudouridine(55) synthase TruB [Gammaproteobacteria bacterium]|nr:tRNA pseudouridine(55) synthase TruB [Gammaproteobacteria bacterium]MDH4315572.1 tRNA pseudouridine(55) synthase TruB [Gammaproteobacteria bacterium]MDH5215043.1 tRNA pseudouridine(55) synthase TruB [Gammaproteobacteria bacterium]
MNAGTQSRPVRAAVDGLLLLNKPAGLTSNQALQKVKRLLNAKKAGHTGSLDPAATGMLPLCFGEATKVCAYLLEADKTYRVTGRLGEATDTGDADGEVIDTADIPALDRDDWDRVLQSFVGNIEQVPPMYSALKKDGKRLYELARKGQVVEREARPVRINWIELIELSGKRLVFRVSCSKGTYVRTLVEDVAKAAGTIAHTANLHRETVGNFRAEDMLDLPGAEQVAAGGAEALRARLLPADSALSDWPSARVGQADAERFSGGQRIGPGAIPQGLTGYVRVYDEADRFVGIGELAEDGRLAPRRIFR